MIIPLLPFYIAGVFVEMTVEGTVFATLKTFGVVLVMAIVMHWLWPPCCSSVPVWPWAAPGPAHQEHAASLLHRPRHHVQRRHHPGRPAGQQNNGVSDGIANFTVPLCATIHLCGSTITLVTCATAVMFLSEHLAIPGIDTMLPFIMMLGVIMIAAPGAPVAASCPRWVCSPPCWGSVKPPSP